VTLKDSLKGGNKAVKFINTCSMNKDKFKLNSYLIIGEKN